MFEQNKNVRISQPSSKSFGVVFSIVFLMVGLYPVINSEGLNLWAIALSSVLLLMAFFAPNALALPNRIWFEFGMLLGSFVAPLVMVFVYFVAVVPTGFAMRFFGKDVLRLKLDKSAESYWVKRKDSLSSMKNQF